MSAGTRTKSAIVAGLAAAAIMLGGCAQGPAPAPAPATDQWERDYEAQQKAEKAEKERAERWSAIEKFREEREFEKRQAQREHDTESRRAQLPPTPATFEALLHASNQAEKVLHPAGSPEKEAADALWSDLFWLRDEVKRREGVQAVWAACDRVYGDDGQSGHYNPSGRHAVCGKFTGEGQ